MAEIATAKSVTWGEARSIIKSKRFEENIAALLKEWAMKHPDELVALDRMTHAMRRENAYRKTFGQTAKDMAHFAEVPVSLFKMMQKRVRRDWMNRQDIAEIFFRHFRVGLLNLKSMPDFEK